MISKIIGVVLWIVILLLYILAKVVAAVTQWYQIRFGVSFEEILFTITSPMDGSDVSFLQEAVDYALANVLQWDVLVLFVIICILILKTVSVKIKVNIWKFQIKLDGYKLFKVGCFLAALTVFASSVYRGCIALELDDYIARKLTKTTIYEDYYVKPSTDIITYDEQPKNLIYIYVESMETTYASIEAGGAQDINYIPRLTQLATDNVSFSDTDKLGGAYVTAGAGWTMGALFASTTGVPFSFPIEGNSMNRVGVFAPGIVSLGDMLEEFGYRQYFLCGSDGDFAGRGMYFHQHGNYEVLDYYYALDKGYIPAGYYVWWGYEDKKLFDIAKTELLEIVESDEPFNFTMLTADTHHVDGYICEHCPSMYDHQLGNVLECTDKQVYEFIEWCQQQDFYEDTVIVITGDHFRMDSSLVADKERRLYNCIINSDTVISGESSNRIYTTLDIFPTTLSAMGFEIEGDRLGLGTDLFSDRQTLAEELGVWVVYDELGKYSDYYVEEFE